MKTKAPITVMTAYCGWEFRRICIDTYVDNVIQTYNDLSLEAAEGLLAELRSAIADYKKLDEQFEEDQRNGLFDGAPMSLDDIEF